jgi:hypothetical protein
MLLLFSPETGISFTVENVKNQGPVHLSLFNLITLIMIVKRTNYEAPHDAVCTSS